MDNFDMINVKLRNKLNALLFVCVLIVCTLFMFGCNDDKNNPYSHDNNFEVEILDGEDSLEFAPKNFEATFGFVFYCGLAVSPSYYSYFGEALAKQGYLVIIPKKGNTHSDYIANEPAFTKHKNVRFAIGGHDEGGGVAIRHAMDYGKYGNYIKGVALFAPIDFSRPQYDEQGRPILDSDGNMVLTQFTIANLKTPTLLLQVDDAAFSSQVKEMAKEHLNLQVTTEYVLNSSTSKEFCMNDVESEAAIAQRNATVQYTLAFLKKLATSK